MSQAFLTALKSGDLAALSAILDADSALVDARADGMSAVTTAVFHGHPAAAALLIARGAALDIFDAAMTGQLGQVRKLVRADSAIVNAVSPQGHTVFGLACFFGQPEVGGYLLGMGADVHQRAENPMRVQALHAAVAGGHYGLSKAVIEQGADVNATQQSGFTPLQAAAQSGNLAITQLLLAHGADKTAVNELGKTALDYAREGGHADVMAILRR
jgi:ankyrin repeat protein